MTKEDLNQLVTLADLERFKQVLFDKMEKLIIQGNKKEFYSPKEFQQITGIKYSTIIHYCNTGQIKARQKGARGAWSIHCSEIERFKNEASDNVELHILGR